MDTLDHLHASQDIAELGPALYERPKVPPEFIAGNRLTDALEYAEDAMGPLYLAEILESVLQSGATFDREPASELLSALKYFRANVTLAVFNARIQARIDRLRS
jgi:hypothetical protein